MTDLLPCPFCGATPDINSPNTFQSNQGDKWGYVVCCCNGPEVRTDYKPVDHWRDAAIAAWNTRATGWQPMATAPGLITLAEQKTGLESAPDRPGPTNEIDVTPEMVRAAIHAYYCGLDPRWHSDEDIFEYVCREIFKFAGLRVRGSD